MVANSSTSLINFRLDLIKAVQAFDYEIHVIAPELSEGTPEHDRLVEQGVISHALEMSRAGINPFSDLLVFWRLFRLIRSIKPSAFLSYTIKPVVWGSLAAFVAGVPQRNALITGLGYAFVEGDNVSKKRALVKWVVQFLYHIALNRCQLVFFQNPDDAALFRDLGILKSSTPTAVVKGSGVNLDHFRPVILPQKPVFLLIARLLIDKGVREYAQAAEKLKVKYPESRFMLVGYLDENPESIKQAELDRWVDEGYIDYLGKLSDIRPAMAEASVFVLPTFYREGIPRTILEALAMGRAVITTDAPGCRETVVNGKNGFLVQPKSVDELIAAMETLILQPSLIISMSNESLQKARDDFDVHKVNDMMLIGMGIK